MQIYLDNLCHSLASFQICSTCKPQIKSILIVFEPLQVFGGILFVDFPSKNSLIKLYNEANVNDRELFSNNITGGIPEELGVLTELVSLDLYMNNLSGSIPSSLGNLKKLIYLYEPIRSLFSL